MSRRLFLIVVCFLLSALNLAVYWQVSAYGFVNLDDNIYIYENPKVQQGLTADGLAFAIGGQVGGNWQPLTLLSYMADITLFGEEPSNHHLINLLLHIANTVALFLVLSAMTGSVWRSGFVAALFAVHPLHVESVAWISERKDVLSTLFWLLALGAYTRYVRRLSSLWYVLAAVFLLCGLLSKAMLVTLPFTLLLLDVWPLGRYGDVRGRGVGRRAGFLVLEKLPLFIIVAIFSVIAMIGQQSSAAVSSLDELSLRARVFNAVVGYGAYLGKTVWPARLSVFYPHPGEGVAMGVVWASAGALIAISALVLWQARRRPYLLVGWLWFVGTLVPVIGLVQIGAQAFADRYTYVPHIGLFIAVVWWIGAWALRGRREAWAAGILGAAVVTAFTVVAWRQAAYWRDSATLWRHAVAHYGDNAYPHLMYAHALREDARVEEAEPHFTRALELSETMEARYWGALGLGMNALDQRQFAKAEHWLSQATEWAPHLPTGWRYLGRALSGLGEDEAAVDAFAHAVAIAPQSWQARSDLALALVDSGAYTQGIEALHEVLREDPTNGEAYLHLARALLQMGELEEAAESYRSALRYLPADSSLRAKIAIMLHSIEMDL